MKSDEKLSTIKPAFSVTVGIICFILLTLFDQMTKRWAVLHLKGQSPIILIKNVFQLRYLENRGAAFGIMQGRAVLFVVITIAVCAVIVFLYARIPFVRRFRLLRILMVLIAAGAVGNFIDRVSQNYVVDFFYINLINFPIFNVADIYVTVSVIILILVIIFMYKEEDFTEMTKNIGTKKRKSKDES